MPPAHVAVIGAGIGGLAAALDLALRGFAVTVLERAATPGGKMREVAVGAARIDAGPTVFTLRGVFDELFAAAGSTLEAHIGLRRVDVLARHVWPDGTRLDLHADLAGSADAIGAFAGPDEARRFLAFSAAARRTFHALERSYLRSPAPNPLTLVRAAGWAGLPDLLRIRPFATLWRALSGHFRDPRLVQLFGRYATYGGSSPWAAPATLMLIAHVEREGVWLVDGGMFRLAEAIAALAARHGVRFRYETPVAEVAVDRGRARGVVLRGGERIDADAVVVNADVAAVATGHLGRDAARAVPSQARAVRSLSAVTFSLVAPAAGFPLARHTVFFSSDYAAEFAALFRDGRLPGAPTVYVCAQDRDDRGAGAPVAERLLCLVNAPPNGDGPGSTEGEITRCEQSTFEHLARCGLQLARDPARQVTTTPADFERLFPGTGGALYGRATHGWRASFQRPPARSRIPGLYLAGGSAHPGAGVPMAALSGRMAAAALGADWVSTRRSLPAATPGGTSTPSPTTAGTR
jgi:1-hydroxycarotenoid 3,4-desaturase